MSEIYGNIHSIESCGTVDGPGIRFVVFTQGCPLRCQYCHNPDTWEFKDNQKISVDEILKQYESVKEFCSGGITVTGGEPLCQIDFVTELFKRASAKGINTALDTSGVLFNKNNTQKIDELLKYLGASLEDTYAFGDGPNDLEMLQYVQYGTAMGNAEESVLRSAEYRTEGIWEDGVARALERYGLIGRI